MPVQAKVIADSISPSGSRLVTIEVQLHRFILAELNTHRKFSRNSASSRAIPITKQLELVKTDPAIPIEWGSKKAGMQAGPPLEGYKEAVAKEVWLQARDRAVKAVETLDYIGLHKQVANRLLEPFLWHKVIITANEWENFFSQRCSPLAQPEIRLAAELAREAYRASTPKLLRVGEYHTPYISEDEYNLDPKVRIKASVARSARVSYLNHDGIKNLQSDMDLFQRLASAEPPHWSPMEHVATPYSIRLSPAGNFIDWKRSAGSGNWMPYGWSQLRHNMGLVLG